MSKFRAIPSQDHNTSIRTTHWYGSRRFSAPPDENGGAGTEDLAEGDPQPDLETLKPEGRKALEEERKQRKALEKALAELKQKYSGIDPAKIEELEAKQKEREEKDLLEQQRYDEVLNRLKTQHQNEQQSANDRIMELQKLYENTLIEQAVTEAFVEAGGRSDTSPGGGPKAFAKLLLPVIRNQILVENGEIVIVDKNGDQRQNLETRKPYSLADLMNDCRSGGATSALFEPFDKASGAGSKGSRFNSRQQQDALAGLTGAARLARARELGLS